MQSIDRAPRLRPDQAGVWTGPEVHGDRQRPLRRGGRHGTTAGQRQKPRTTTTTSAQAGRAGRFITNGSRRTCAPAFPPSAVVDHVGVTAIGAGGHDVVGWPQRRRSGPAPAAGLPCATLRCRRPASHVVVTHLLQGLRGQRGVGPVLVGDHDGAARRRRARRCAAPASRAAASARRARGRRRTDRSARRRGRRAAGDEASRAARSAGEIWRTRPRASATTGSTSSSSPGASGWPAAAHAVVPPATAYTLAKPICRYQEAVIGARTVPSQQKTTVPLRTADRVVRALHGLATRHHQKPGM